MSFVPKVIEWAVSGERLALVRMTLRYSDAFGYGRPEIARLLRSTDSGLYNKNSCPPWKLYFADS